MDYDKLIVNILNRICALEEQVKILNEEKKKDEIKIGTSDIERYICELKQKATIQGNEYIEIVANDIHKMLKLKHRMPMVCNAMRNVMTDKDVIIHQPPKGNSTTLKIKYFL